MKPADYKCTFCKGITEFWIENDKKFPKTVICKICGWEATRIFSPLFPIVHQGKCGNSKNGYKSNEVKIKKS